MIQRIPLFILVFAAGCGGSAFTVANPEDDAAETGDDAMPAETSTEAALETGDLDTTPPPVDTGSGDTGTLPTDAPLDTGAPDTATTESCVDGDGDGEGSLACGGLDCHDGNKSVFSKQAAWFDKPYTAAAGGESWDYNCSGKAELEWPDRFVCMLDASGTACTFKKGYVAAAACGAPIKLVVKCDHVISPPLFDGGTPEHSCEAKTVDFVSATQRCH